MLFFVFFIRIVSYLRTRPHVQFVESAPTQEILSKASVSGTVGIAIELLTPSVCPGLSTVDH